MKLKCATCGQSFEAQRSTAKYCTEKCKKRRTRTTPRPAPAPSRPVLAVVPDPPAVDPEVEYAGMPVTLQAVRELDSLGIRESVDGEIILGHARRLDTEGLDTGASRVAVAKQMREMLDSAQLKAAGKIMDPVDQLRARRDKKIGQARANGRPGGR